MNAARANAAAWLSLAAAPTFALMALVTTFQDAGSGVLVCSSAVAGGSPLGGMGVMYLLMSGFHLGPWLRLRAH